MILSLYRQVRISDVCCDVAKAHGRAVYYQVSVLSQGVINGAAYVCCSTSFSIMLAVVSKRLPLILGALFEFFGN
jgi:hypothetical protein